MTPLVLVAVWIAAGVVGTAAAAVLPRRLAVGTPLLTAAAAGLTMWSSTWPGPAGDGHGLVLGRIGVGLLVASALSAALCLLLSATLQGSEPVSLAAAGASGVVIMAATSPLIWSAAILFAVGAIVLRWLSVAPGRATLSAARVAGVGAAALLAAAPFAGAGGATTVARSAVTATLLAAGVASVVGVPPLGGWASGCLAGLRGAELTPWALVLVPAVLVSAGGLADGLPSGSRDGMRTLLLVIGVVGALWGAVNTVLAPAARRYGRLLLTDLALAVAAIGTGQPAGRPAVLVLVLMHLAVAPLLLHPARPGLSAPRRLAWLAVSGAPLTVGFWARLLVVQACAGVGIVAVLPALAAAGLAVVAAVAPVLGDRSTIAGPPAGRGLTLGAWAPAILGLAVGVAPQAVARFVFGGL